VEVFGPASTRVRVLVILHLCTDRVENTASNSSSIVVVQLWLVKNLLPSLVVCFAVVA
jgi:hypothetical protein